MGKDLQRMTWEEFKELFYNKYFTADIRAQRVIEFFSLRQGDKSVSEYARKLEQLRKNCTVLACNTLQAFIDKALKVDQEITARRKKSYCSFQKPKFMSKWEG